LTAGTYPPDSVLEKSSLPDNKATLALAKGLATAHVAYGSSKSSPSLPLCVLFVVQEPERNIFDQRHVEYALQKESIPVFRLPFSSTLKHTIVSEDSSRLLVYTPLHNTSIRYEVSVVYFRSTYTPSDFPDEDHWNARYQLERSAAIKCPSILTHLAGSKKVQQVLATPSSPHLARFINDISTAERIRKTFADIFPLDGSDAGKQAKALATDNERSNGYVLKPQREGGGNNVYRKAIPKFLASLGDESKWRGHILMELIEPPSQKNFIFRNGVLKGGEVIAELGVFGTCLWHDRGEILSNEEAGYLLRTKGRESEEGGVAAGFGSIDSVCLVDL
jgi:glutathione synthase